MGSIGLTDGVDELDIEMGWIDYVDGLDRVGKVLGYFIGWRALW